MWIIGTVILLVVGAAVTAAMGRTPRAVPSPPLWDTAKLGGTNISALGAFAGFSLTSAIFIAGFDVARSSPAFSTVFGMMLISFLILVMAAWIAGSTPSVPQAEGTPVQSLTLVLGNLCANLGVSITWLALAPLMVVIGLPAQRVAPRGSGRIRHHGLGITNVDAVHIRLSRWPLRHKRFAASPARLSKEV